MPQSFSISIRRVLIYYCNSSISSESLWNIRAVTINDTCMRRNIICTSDTFLRKRCSLGWLCSVRCSWYAVYLHQVDMLFPEYPAPVGKCADMCQVWYLAGLPQVWQNNYLSLTDESDMNIRYWSMMPPTQHPYCYDCGYFFLYLCTNTAQNMFCTKSNIYIKRLYLFCNDIFVVPL